MGRFLRVKLITEINQSICSLCGGQRALLPLPHASKALVSDGRVLETALQKDSCLSCGLVSHTTLLSSADVRSVYEQDYALSAASPIADRQRAESYVGLLNPWMFPTARVLEIGCGSGALLKAIAARWPQATLFGLDPALPLHVERHDSIRFERGFFEQYSGSTGSMDLVFSINVVEHISSPKEFFSGAASLLAPGGHLLVVCPASNPPNLELTFHDHLHTFTAAALSAAARSAGLFLIGETCHLGRIGDFQLAIFAREPAGQLLPVFSAQDGDLFRARTDYLLRWASLDQVLIDRTSFSTRVVVFGAGQMAALLRAYAPLLWTRIDMLVMDNIADAWRFEKSIATYSSQKDQLRGVATVVATSPGTQKAISERLSADGLAPICFDDIIVC